MAVLRLAINLGAVGWSRAPAGMDMPASSLDRRKASVTGPSRPSFYAGKRSRSFELGTEVKYK